MGGDTIFEQDIAEARRLDFLRKQALDMIKNGLDGLFSSKYEDREGWSPPGDYIEKALLLQVLLKHEKRWGTLETELLELLKKLTIRQLFDTGNFLNPVEDHVPLLKASVTLDTLSSIPGTILSQGAINCYYRILYELNTANPDEIMGGASAGAKNVPKTAFITWRCVRAVLSLSNAFAKTAKFVSECAILAKPKPEKVPKMWWDVHLETTSLQTEVTLMGLKDFLLFDVKVEINENMKVDQLIEVLKSKLSEGVQNAKNIIRIIKGQRNQNKHFDKYAHKKAVKSLEEHLQELETCSKEGNPEKMSDSLEKITRGILDTLEPAKKFFTSIMDHELAASDPQRHCDAAELLFAADGYGRLCGWYDYRLVPILEKVVPLLTNNGRIPSYLPFDVAEKGYVLNVAGAESIRALSDLVSQMQYPISAETVEKLLRHFKETWRDDVQGWRHERDHSRGNCAWWLSALSIQTLNSIKRMVDQRTNQLILKHLSVRQPDKLILGLDSLFYSDYGLVAAKVRAQSIAISFQRLRSHICSVKLSKLDSLHAIILHGPPGTGKTTLVEALAKSAGVPLVEVTPSDILLAGAEMVETRARFVFEGLSMLSNVVILFDEFDPILWRRAKEGARENIFQFITPGMLPKLKNLHESAERQQVAFVLSTNHIEGLDEAATREGRFDAKIGVYTPDALSRTGRLYYELSATETTKGERVTIDEKSEHRIDEVVRDSRGCEMNRLGKRGWFTRPEVGKASAEGTPFDYILKDGKTLTWPGPEKELPKKPEGTPDTEAPSTVYLREWKEWKWVSCLDENIDGVSSVISMIEKWAKLGSTKGSDQISWEDWSKLCDSVFKKG